MTYYITRPTSDPKIIGIKDGTCQATIVRNELTDSYTFDYFEKYYHGDGTYYWKIFDTFPEKELKLGLVELKEKAKLTDFISFHPNAKANGEFLISKRAADLLRKFKLPKHQFYPVTLIKDGETIDSYEYLFCPCLGYEVVDFESSIFYDGPMTKKIYLKIKNHSDFEFHKDNGLLHVEKVSIKKIKDSFDYFSLKVNLTGFYLSDRLKSEFEKMKLTGLNILEMREPYEPRIELV